LPVTVIIGENDEPVVTNVIFGDGAAPAALTSITSASAIISKNLKKLGPLCPLLLFIFFMFNLGYTICKK
jgi:hypothetical protein